MTTFEITITILAVLIVLLMVWLCACLKSGIKCIVAQHKSTWSHFDNVTSQLYGIKETSGSIYNAIGADGCLTTKLLKEILQILDNIHQRQPRIDWGKLSKEQQDEFLKRLICPDYDIPFSPFPPCYARDGICTNPHHDCINCPKQYGGGTYTTATTGIETTNNDK